MKSCGIFALSCYNMLIDKYLQTLAVIYLEFMFLQGASFLALVTLIYLLVCTSFYWITLAYALWYIYDYETSFRGGRINYKVRSLKIWHYYCRYFPMNLIKTADLDSGENYLFAVHPHGIMCLSGFGNFCTEGTNFSKLFPGLTPHVLMLKMLFYMPITRELLLLTGGSAVTSTSFKAILNNQNQCRQKGQVCVVVVGGAAESLEAHANTYRLILKNRKGFVRMALETGASLVPVFSFGENDLFYQLPNPQNTKLRNFQEKLKNVSAIGFPVWWGKGVCSDTFGMLPLKRQINTVIGSPIKVDKNPAPSEHDIVQLHNIYIEELVKLFNQNKEIYGEKNATLEII